MTWEQLVSEICCCNEDGMATITMSFMRMGLQFCKNGNIKYGRFKNSPIIAKNRSPDQMYQIITALTETKESK